MVLHHRDGVDLNLAPVVVFGLFVVLLLEVGADGNEEGVDKQAQLVYFGLDSDQGGAVLGLLDPLDYLHDVNRKRNQVLH